MKLRLFVSLIMFHLLIPLTWADVEHVVERGETIESIAKFYGITPEDILKDNPTAKEMFFAGMILTIKTESQSGSVSSISERSEKLNSDDEVTIDQKNREPVESSREKYTETPVIDSSEEESLFRQGKNYFGFYIGYYFPKEKKSKEGNTRTYSYGFSMMYSLRAGRYFVDNLFGEMNLGFSLSSSSTSTHTFGESSQKYEFTFYNIPLNLHLGYTFPFNNKSGLSIYTGPMFLFPAGIKYKENDKEVEHELKQKTTFNWDLGAELNLGGFSLGGRYTFALNAKEDNPSTPQGIWMVYLGFVF